MLGRGGSLPRGGSGRLSLKLNGLQAWVETIEGAMRNGGDGVLNLDGAKAVYDEAKRIIDNKGALTPNGPKITRHKRAGKRFDEFTKVYAQLGETIERAAGKSVSSAPSSGPSTGVPAPAEAPVPPRVETPVAPLATVLTPAPISRPSSAPAEAVVPSPGRDKSPGGTPFSHAGSDDDALLPTGLAQQDDEPQPMDEGDSAPPVHRPAPPSGAPSPRAGDVSATSSDDEGEPDEEAGRQKRTLRLVGAIEACRQQLQKLAAKQAQQLKAESEACFSTLLKGGDPETQMLALRKLQACYEPLKNKQRALYLSVVNVIALVVEALLVATAAFGIGLAISAWAGPMAVAIGVAAAIAALALATTAEYGRGHVNRFGLFKARTPYDQALDALEFELAPAAAASPAFDLSLIVLA